jgi:hypothetical protein
LREGVGFVSARDKSVLELRRDISQQQRAKDEWRLLEQKLPRDRRSVARR